MKKNTNMTTTTDEVTKLAIKKALTMAKKTAFNTAAKIFSGRYLIPPTQIKGTEKASA
jgi:hypothetical protein